MSRVARVLRWLAVLCVGAVAASLVAVSPASASGNQIIVSQTGDVFLSAVKANPNAAFNHTVSVVQPVQATVCDPCTATPQTVGIGTVVAGTEIVVSLFVWETGRTVYSTNPADAIVVQLDATTWFIDFEDGGGAPIDVTVSVDQPPDGQPVPIGGSLNLLETIGGGWNPGFRYCICVVQQRGDPVDVATGNFSEMFVDLAVPGRGGGLAFTRTYNSALHNVDGPLGFGWTHSYATSLSDDGSSVTIRQENGSQLAFALDNGVYLAPPRVTSTLEELVDGTWRLVRNRHETLLFDAAGRLTQRSDLNGYGVVLSYDPLGRLDGVTDSAGQALTISYTGSRIASVEDHTGRVVHFDYDGVGDLVHATDVNEGVWEFAYTAHRMTSLRSPRFFGDTTTTPAPVTTNTYDSNGRVVLQTDPLGRATSFEYIWGGYGTKVTDPSGNVTLYTISSGLVISETRGYGTGLAATWQYRYDPATLGVTRKADPAGNEVSSTYDSAGNLLTRSDPIGRQTTATYNALNLPLTVTDAEGATTTFTYDGAGNPLTRSRHWEEGPPDTYQLMTLVYGDPQHPGDVTSVIDAADETWAYEYDAAGNQISATDPVGNKSLACFDNLGRRTAVISPSGAAAGATCASPRPATGTSYFNYDSAGRVLTTTDALGHTTTASYDADGHRTDVTDAADNHTQYDYDAAGQLIEVTRPDQSVISDDYDDNGNRAVSRDAAGNETTWEYANPAHPHAPTTMTTPGAGTVTYTYDAVGNRISTTDQSGRVTTFAYDDAHQLTAIDYADAATPDVTSIAYDGLGRRTTMTDGTGTSSWTWDSLGRLVTTVDGDGTQVGFSYNLRGELTAIAYPGGNCGPTPQRCVTRTFDAAGRMQTVTDWVGGTTAFDYDTDGNLTSIERPASNGTLDTIGYDAANRVMAIQTTRGGDTLASFDYGRDNVGRVEAVDDGGVGPNDTYGYDELSQLTTAGPQAFSYDTADNLTEVGSRGRQRFNTAHELCWSHPTIDTGSCETVPTGATTYAYDNQGNRTTTAPPTGTPTSYRYDQANRLVEVADVAAYTYDGDGLRYSKTVGNHTTRFTWDRSRPIPLLLEDGDASYVYGPDGRVLEQLRTVPQISLVGSTSRTDTASAVAMAVPLPADIAKGDTILIASTHPAEVNPTAPPGYETLGTFTSGSGLLATEMTVFIRTATGGETVATINYGAPTYKAAVAAVYRGVDTIGPIEEIASGHAESGTAVSLPALTTSLDNQQLVVITGATGTFLNGGWTPPPGMTERSEAAQALVASALADESLVMPGSTGSRAASFDIDANLVGVALTLKAPPEVAYYHHDQLGSVRLITNTAGQAIGADRYGPFGSSLEHTRVAEFPTTFGFAGEYRDPETGLVYLRNRSYDPETGQFLTRDPLESMTHSPYAYAENNPTNNTDPLGLFCVGGLCTEDVVDGLETLGGAIDDAWDDAYEVTTDAIDDAADFAWRNRGTIATIGAAGTCLIPGVGLVGCGYAATAALAVRAEQRIDEDGFSNSLRANLTDGALTYLTLGLGGAFETLAGPWAGVNGLGALERSALLSYLGRLFPSGYDLTNLSGWLNEQC